MGVDDAGGEDGDGDDALDIDVANVRIDANAPPPPSPSPPAAAAAAAAAMTDTTGRRLPDVVAPVGPPVTTVLPTPAMKEEAAAPGAPGVGIVGEDIAQQFADVVRRNGPLALTQVKLEFEKLYTWPTISKSQGLKARPHRATCGPRAPTTPSGHLRPLPSPPRLPASSVPLHPPLLGFLTINSHRLSSLPLLCLAASPSCCLSSLPLLCLG